MSPRPIEDHEDVGIAILVLEPGQELDDEIAQAVRHEEPPYDKADREPTKTCALCIARVYNGDGECKRNAHLMAMKIY